MPTMSLPMGERAMTLFSASSSTSESVELYNGTWLVAGGRLFSRVALQPEYGSDLNGLSEYYYRESIGIGQQDKNRYKSTKDYDEELSGVLASNSVAIGWGSTVHEGRAAHRGYYAEPENSHGVGNIYQADVENKQGKVAIGWRSWAQSGRSLSVGEKAKSYESSIAIGGGAIAGKPLSGYADTTEDDVYHGNSHDVYVLDERTFLHDIAIGADAVSRGKGSIAMGYQAQNLENGQHNFHPRETSLKDVQSNGEENMVAIGTGASSGGADSVAIGTYARTNIRAGVAIGFEATSSNHSVAIGPNTRNKKSATDNSLDNQISIGNNAESEGNDSVAIGTQARANIRAGVAIGFQTEAYHDSVAIGALSLIHI